MTSFMNLVSLALRNLLRNRRRSLTTMLAMIVGAVAILMFGGYSRDINYGLQTNFVQTAGHLQIQHKDYFLYGSGNPAAYGIADYVNIAELVRKDPVLGPMLTVVTPTLSLGGLAGNFEAGVSRTVFGRGVQVGDLNRMRRWNDFQMRGTRRELALTGTAPDSAVIGTGVARVLQLCAPLQVRNCPSASPAAAGKEPSAAADAPSDIAGLAAQERQVSKAATSADAVKNATAGGSIVAAATGAGAAAGAAGPVPAGAATDGLPAESPNGAATPSTSPRIELLAANARGAPNVAGLQVVKAEPQGVKELDDMFVMLHLSQAQRLVYGAAPPQVTAIVLQLQHTSQMPAARARLDQLLAGELKSQDLEIQDFATLNPSYGQTIGMFAAIFGFISVLIGAIVLFTVGNTMSMAVVERTVEIGTLRAIGLRRAGIRRLFVTEGLLLGVFGATLGVLIAVLGAWLINQGGLTWLPPGQIDPVPLTVRVWGETRMMVGTAIGLIVVAVVSAWWPARRAATLNIVDALRHA